MSSANGQSIGLALKIGVIGLLGMIAAPILLFIGDEFFPALRDPIVVAAGTVGIGGLVALLFGGCVWLVAVLRALSR